MALDGAKFICLAEAAAGDATEATSTAATGDVAGDSAEAAATKGEVIEAKGREFTVGYYMNCDYVLDDRRANGVHCEILCDAFGRVTIHNLSESHPISVNGQIIEIKRPLLDGSRIKILDKHFLWKFPKSVETTASSSNKQVEGDAEDENEISTPQKMAGVAEQAPNSCPDLKPHRKVDKRFTVHNFAYCINSDDEGNTSSEIPSITESDGEEVVISADTNKSKANEYTSSQLSEVGPNELGVASQSATSQDIADGKKNVERRSVTPEPQPSAPTIASTPLIKLDYTPKTDMINCTQNKENKSTEKKRRQLSLCHRSDVVITSYSPRETGVRIEKSFTAVFKPSATCLATTPKSVYNTPKSVLSDYNDESSRDFIDFTTPATSKKALGLRAVAGNSSMHLIDLTTPNKLAPASSRPRPTLKFNKTLPSDVKLSNTPIAFAKVKEVPEEEEGFHALPVTPLIESSTSKSNTTPQSAESVISVDGSTDSSTAVIEISTEDSATTSTSSTSTRSGVSSKTPQCAAGQKQLTSTPLRTPQSLMKRAILTSAKKQVNTPLRTALSRATPIRQLPTTPTCRVNVDGTGGSARSTPKGRIAIGSPSSVAAEQRPIFTPRRNLAGASSTSTPTRERAITTSTPLQAGATLGRKVPASASRVAGAKRTSPLRGVRKSFSGTTLASHVSKPRRSIAPPRKHSPTSIGAQLVAKARKSLCTPNASRGQIASRARSLVAAAVSGQSEMTNLLWEKTENADVPSDTPGKEGKQNVSSGNIKNEADELSRTFRVDDSLEEVNVIDENPDETTAQNVTFSPAKQDFTKQTDATESKKQEINKTFSPDKSISVVDGEVGPDIPLGVTETSVVAQQEDSVKDFKEKEENNMAEHISESFAEVVESSDKSEEANNAQETAIASHQNQEQSVVAEQLLDTGATTLEGDQQADIANLTREIENITEAETQRTTKQCSDQVLETLDADEVSIGVIVAQLDGNEAETNLVTPLPTEALEVEVVPKTTGESQGTAELLEEIEYVLNKSDELQQQLGKDVHNKSDGNEDAVELETAIAVNLGEKIEELVATDNTNASDSTARESPLKAAQETKANKLGADAEGSTISAQNDDNGGSEDPNSSKVSPDVEQGVEEDVLSIDSDMLASTSEIANTDLDAGSMKTEIVSITSITTPSEFDVSTIGRSSVEKIITAEEQEAVSKQPMSVGQVDQSTNNAAEPEIKVLGKATAVVNTSIAPESTTGDVEEKSVDYSETDDASDEIGDKTKVTKTEPKSDAITSEPAVVESVKSGLIENEETKTPKGNVLCTDDEVEQQTSETDNNLNVTPAAGEAKSSTIVPSSNKFGKVDTEKYFIGDTKADPAKAIEESVSEPKMSLMDSEKPTTNITSIPNDSNEVLAEATNQPGQSSNENATMSIETITTVVEIHETPKSVDVLTSEEEKENKIITADEDNTSTVIATEPGATASDPKTPNLRGIREMLRTPKQSDTSTLRFIGLRNLMRTPKASTSVAAASAAIEDDEEELIGIEALLKTPCQSKRNTQTPQPTTENSAFTPRRSARRRASASADLTPTRCVTPTLEIVTEVGTPRRTSRRRASASTEVSYTPQRITRRRSSLSLDNEEAVAAALTPQKRGGLRAIRTTILAECPVAEDMGAIIEEELKEAVQKSTDIQPYTVEADKNYVGNKSEATVPNLAEVIEESICEEVNTKKQQDLGLNPAIIEEVNLKNEKNSNLTNEVQRVQPCAQPAENEKSAETESESRPNSSFKEFPTDEKGIIRNSSDSTDNAKAIATNGGTEELPEIHALATVETNESAEILDESDYEYGKEVKEEGEANSAADVPSKTLKIHRKSVKILDAATESPKTPVMVGMRELLKTPKPCADTPKLIGVRDLVRTPKSAAATAAADLADDEKRFSGLADLLKTHTATTRVTKQAQEEEEVFSGEEEKQEEPSTSNAAHDVFVGVRELLKTPKHTSTPQYRGMRELLRTPKACSTPQLAGLDELMQTPKRTKLNAQYDDEHVELDQFLKTPRAKYVMIPGEPASAVLEPSADTTLDIMTATTEYELHSNSQRPLEDIYKTPVSTRLTSVDTITEDVEENTEKENNEKEDKKVVTSTTCESDIELIIPETPATKTTTKRNLSAEEAFEELVGERTTLDETPPQKVYERKRQSVAATTSLLSPFSATDVISDLPKTDIQEWVDRLEQSAEAEEEEQEVTVSASLLEASKEKHDPIAASVCETSVIGVNKDTTEELLADISAVSSMADPLLPSAAKSTKSVLTSVVDEIETLRPTTPIESEISGINLLDQTNDSEFSEPLVVSDCESVLDKQENKSEEKEKTDIESTKTQNETAPTDANKSMGEEEFPIMFVDSSDSEAEDADKIGTNDGNPKPEAEALAVEETIKSTQNTEIIDLDDSSASESIESTPLNNSKAVKNTNVIDIHAEFSNFQPHKNLASLQIRAYTPNRCSKVRQPQYTRARRQSMGAEKLLASTFIDLTLEKSRLAGERANSVALVDECIIEIDEESMDQSTVSEKVTNLAEEGAENTESTAEMSNDERNKEEPTPKASEDLHAEFSNFQAHKTIASRGKRAATPDPVNKTHAQKISQAARRLTLGAEHRLVDVTVDFVEEKTKLEKSKQQPAHIDDIQEVDDSDNECDTNAEVTQNNVSASESAAKVESSNGESKEETLKPVQVMEEEQAIDTGKLSGQVNNIVEPIEQTTVNEEKEIAKTSAAPTEHTVKNKEAEIRSTSNADDIDDIQIIQDTTEMSAIEVTQTKPIDQKSVEPDVIPAKEVTIAKSSADVILENENQPVVSSNAEPSIEEDIATDKPVIKELTLKENEQEIPPNVESSISKETATKVYLAKEVINQENEAEVPSTAKSSTVKSDSRQKPESSGNVVSDEGSGNASPMENEFNERDIFDLSDEPPKEPLTVNTTQGVIFDLTEEEAAEESVEQKIEEIATHNVISSIQQTEKKKAENTAVAIATINIDVKNNQLENDEVIPVEIETVVATALKDTEVPLEITPDESTNEIDTESNHKATITTENGSPTSITELNISQESADLTSAVVEEAVSANIDASTVNRNNKEVAEAKEAEIKNFENQEATAVVQQSQPNDAAEAAINTKASADVQSPEGDKVHALAVCVESTAVAKINEDVAETSQAALEIPHESPKLDTASVEVSEPIGETADEMERNDANSEADGVVESPELVEVGGSANLNINEEKAEVDNLGIELDSDVEEIAEERLANTANKHKTSIEKDISPATIENKAKKEIESTTVKGINSEKIVTPTATTGAVLSQPAISEKSANDVKEEVIEERAQLHAAENIAEITHTLEESPPKASEVVAIKETKEASQQNQTEAPVRQINLPEEGQLDEAAQQGEKVDEAASESRIIADQTETSVQQESIPVEGDLDAPTTSDRAYQPAKRTSRKPSRSKQQGADESEHISKAATEIKSVSEESGAIVKEPQLDTTAKLVEENVQLEPLVPTETIGEPKLQGEEAEKNIDKPLPSSLKADGDNNEEIVEATSSDGKQQPANLRVRKPSRSKKTAAEEKVESNAEALTKGEILVMKGELAEQKLQLHIKLPGHKEESENKSEERLPETPTEDISEESSMQVAEVESSEPPVKRRGRKPSQSKQTAAEKVEVISKATIECEALEEEGRAKIKEKPQLERTEENMLQTGSEMPTAELEAAVKVRTPETSTKIIENVAKEEKLSEVTTSVGKQQPAKLKGRKQSRSNQITEGIEGPISKVIIENKALVEEIEINANEASISKANTESKKLVEESAPVEEQVTEKKSELQTHIKASYEVRLMTTSETADIALDEKPIEVAFPLESSSEKLDIENKPASWPKSENEDKAVASIPGSNSEVRQEITSTTETFAGTETTDKHEDAHVQRPTRRNRKGSQSSQCSTQDEDHLPTTTRRRGGRRRAETPIEHSADETTPSEAPTSKRRRGQGKEAEDVHLEDIQEVQSDEPEITTGEHQTIKTAEAKNKKKLETEGEHITSDDNNSEKKLQDEVLTPATTLLQSVNKIDDVSGDTPGAEEVDEVATKDTVEADTGTLTKRGTSRRHRGERVAEEAAKSVEKGHISEMNAENTNEQHIDVEVSVTSAMVTVAKRGKRKQTVSESSQTSNTAEHIESHPTQRRRRGRMPTTEEQEVVETSDTSKEGDAAAIAAVLPALIEVTELASSNFPEEEIEKDGDTIKTERENEEGEHHSTAETSKLALTRNKRAFKSSETTKGCPQLSEAAEDFKSEPKKEIPLVKEDEQITKTATAGRKRVNRRMKAEADEDPAHKKQSFDEAQKAPESANADPVAKTTENAELTVEQPPNPALESVGGRRGRRGAAAAATVAINEVSSAHKRGAPRGKIHQIKPQTTQQKEEMKKETGEDSRAEAREEVSVVEEKKPHRNIRKRRESTAESQSTHTEDAEKSKREEIESSTKAVAKRVRRRRESHHADESQGSNKQEPSSAPPESPAAASSSQRSRRKRKDSLNSVEGTAIGDSGGEPPNKRPLSRKRRDSSLDSSIHEGAGGDADTNAGGNTSSSSTTPHRSRNVPRRAVAAQDRNYDESSDAEAQVDLKRRIEKASLPKTNTSSATAAANAASKHRSPTAAKTSTAEAAPMTVKEIASKTVSTPILSAVATTSRGGRQRKPTARVQQYLEEERAKAETPKKRLLLASTAGAETPTSQARGAPARRGRKASAIETEAPETSQTPVRGRARTAKAANVAATSEESRSEVEHTHSELETTHSSSLAEEKELKTTAKVIKRPARRGKQAEANLQTESDLNEAQQTSAAIVPTPRQQAHAASGRGGRAAKETAAAALITDEPTGSHSKARGGRGRRGAHVDAAEEEQHTDVETKGARVEVTTPSIEAQKPTKQARNAAAGGRAGRGGRRNKPQDDEDDARSHTSQHVVQEDSEASSSGGPQQSLAVDADDEHEEDEEALTITEEEEEKPLATVKGANAAGKKRTATTRKVATATTATEPPAPKRGRRRAVAEQDDATHIDTASESTGSSRSRKVVRFDAATPSSTASAEMLAEAVAEEVPAQTTAPAKRATRSRRK